MASISGDFNTGLLEHWELEETSGNRTGSKNSTSLTDVSTVGYAAGILASSNAADFERGNGEYLTNATAVGSGINDDLSFSLWIKPESLPGSGDIHQLISYQIVSGSESYFFDLILINQSGTQKVRFYCEAATNLEEYYNHSMSAGNWYHIGLSFIKGGAYNITINGSSVKTGTAPAKKTSSPFTGGSYLEIGEVNYHGTRYGRYWDGLIDEFSFWNTALSTANFSTIYNSGTGIPYASAGATVNSGFFNFM
jgi:hypothetical protein